MFILFNHTFTPVGILKRHFSARSFSECQNEQDGVDFTLGEGLSSELDLLFDESTTSLSEKFKKQVRFNDRIERKTFRPNASIVGKSSPLAS